ncbi:MAG: uroporphyrinogen-III synthase [Bacteroidetes bacterium]|nr:uroporphyrinogen-III synthase [Bacteroidota bacterium]
MIVLSTRPERTPAFESILEQAGCAVVHIPLIRIEAPESWDALDTALDRLDRYAGVLLTSLQAVRWFVRRLEERGIDRNALPPLHAIGEKTAAEAAERGLEVQELPSSAYGATLAAELPDVEGRLFLQPTSDIAREEVVDGIRARGGDVEQVQAYRTLPASGDALRDLRKLHHRGIGCVAFFSPSAVRQFIAALPELRQDATAVAVIGRTTAAEAEEHHLRVDVIAREQSAESLATGIVEWMRARDA